MLSHIFTYLRLETGEEIEVAVRPDQILVIEEVSFAKSWVIQGQDQIVPMELVELVEVVAYH